MAQGFQQDRAVFSADFCAQGLFEPPTFEGCLQAGRVAMHIGTATRLFAGWVDADPLCGAHQPNQGAFALALAAANAGADRYMPGASIRIG